MRKSRESLVFFLTRSTVKGKRGDAHTFLGVYGSMSQGGRDPVALACGSKRQDISYPPTLSSCPCLSSVDREGQ